MRNPTYSSKFHDIPRPERRTAMNRKMDGSLDPSGPTLSIGIKTLSRTRAGLKTCGDVVVIEIKDGDELASMELSAKCARTYAQRLMEFADTLESKKAS